LQAGVVGASAFGVAEGEIRLLQLTEALFGLGGRQGSGIGVVVLAQPAEGLAQLPLRRIGRDLQQRVVVGSCHQPGTVCEGS